ncbi:unnamed protein product, partial [Didymodactylos carnosus]
RTSLSTIHHPKKNLTLLKLLVLTNEPYNQIQYIETPINSTLTISSGWNTQIISTNLEHNQTATTQQTHTSRTLLVTKPNSYILNEDDDLDDELEDGGGKRVKRAFTCKTDGYFPDYNNCRIYHMCNAGIDTAVVCGEGTAWDPEKKNCGWTDTVECRNGVRKWEKITDIRGMTLFSTDPARAWRNKKKSTTRRIALKVDSNYTCEYDSEGYYPDPKYCHVYHYCAVGVHMPIACGEGLWYSSKDDGCVWPKDSDCKAGHLYTSSTSPSVSEGNYTTAPSRRPGTVYPIIECPKGVSKYFEDPYDCTAYHFCNGGRDTVMLCEPGLYYHKGHNTCDWRKNVPECENRCPTNGQRMRFVDPSSCCQYFECITGQLKEQICPPYKLFSTLSKSCESHQVVQCGTRKECIVPCDYDHSPLCAFKPACKDLLDGHYIDKYRPSCQFHYTCLDKRTHNYTACEHGYRFSEDKKQCLLAKHVKCAGIMHKYIMTARDQIRAMLDQLMGSQDGSSKANIPFDDPRVCRSFLLGCCPHEILSGTALDVLNQFVVDCDRKTEHAKRKLRETQEELGEEAARKMNAIHELGELVGTKLAKAEELGAQGLVDESMKLLDEVEQLKRQKSDAEHEFRSTMPASTYQQQKLRVCEVCSAYLGIHDNDRRLADHFGGKLHLGFIQIREKLTDLKKRVSEWKDKRDLERKPRRSFTRTTSIRNRADQRVDRGGGGGGGFARDDYRSSNRSDNANGRTKQRTKSRSRSKKRSSRDRRRSRSRSDSGSRRSSKRSKHSKSSSHRRHKRSRSRSQSRHRRSKSRSHSKKHSSSHHRHKHDKRRSSNYSSSPVTHNGREQQERSGSHASGEKQMKDREEGEEDQQNEERKLTKLLEKYEGDLAGDNQPHKRSEVVQEDDDNNITD